MRDARTGVPQTVDEVGSCHCEPVPQHWCGNPYSPKATYYLTLYRRTDSHGQFANWPRNDKLWGVSTHMRGVREDAPHMLSFMLLVFFQPFAHIGKSGVLALVSEYAQHLFQLRPGLGVDHDDAF